MLPSLVLAAVAGVLMATGFLAPAAGLVGFLAMAPLTAALRRTSSWRQALLVGWCAGAVFVLVGYHWFVTLFEQFAGANTVVAVLGTIGFSVAQGSLHGAMAVLAHLLWRRAGLPLGVAVVAALLTAEHLYPALFPTYLGNHLVLYPLFTQSADLGGPLLVSGVAALVGVAIEELWAARLERRAMIRALPFAGAVVLAASAAYGSIRLTQMDAIDSSSTKLRTAIVQGNVGAADKHLRATEGIERYRTMTDEVMAQGAHELVVWPESAYNRFLKSDVTDLQGKVATEVKSSMIVGALRREQGGPDTGGRKMWNTAFAVAPGGSVVGRYDKNVLLAFGEYVPGVSFLPAVIKKLLPFTSAFEHGTSVEPLPVGPYRASTNICYEDTLAGHVRTLMAVVDDQGAPPHVQVNITNDSWYGPKEPPIHLALATFRAIEHRRWMVRATATGISAFVDSAGRVRAQTAFERAEVLEHDVPMITGPRTVYGVLGPWPGWCALLVAVVALAWSALRRPAPSST